MPAISAIGIASPFSSYLSFNNRYEVWSRSTSDCATAFRTVGALVLTSTMVVSSEVANRLIAYLIIIKMAASKSVCKSEIFLAIERGDLQHVDQILQMYPDLVNLRASNSWSPVMFAARFGHLETVKLLVDYGANLEQRNPLHAAAFSQFSNY